MNIKVICEKCWRCGKSSGSVLAFCPHCGVKKNEK